MCLRQWVIAVLCTPTLWFSQEQFVLLLLHHLLLSPHERAWGMEKEKRIVNSAVVHSVWDPFLKMSRTTPPKVQISHQLKWHYVQWDSQKKYGLEPECSIPKWWHPLPNSKMAKLRFSQSPQIPPKRILSPHFAIHWSCWLTNFLRSFWKKEWWLVPGNLFPLEKKGRCVEGWAAKEVVNMGNTWVQGTHHNLINRQHLSECSQHKK